MLTAWTPGGKPTSAAAASTQLGLAVTVSVSAALPEAVLDPVDDPPPLVVPLLEPVEAAELAPLEEDVAAPAWLGAVDPLALLPLPARIEPLDEVAPLELIPIEATGPAALPERERLPPELTAAADPDVPTAESEEPTAPRAWQPNITTERHTASRLLGVMVERPRCTQAGAEPLTLRLRQG